MYQSYDACSSPSELLSDSSRAPSAGEKAIAANAAASAAAASTAKAGDTPERRILL